MASEIPTDRVTSTKTMNSGHHQKMVTSAQQQVFVAAEAQNSQQVNLSDTQILSLSTQQTGHVLSNPWYINIDISGFGALGHYSTGSAGSKPVAGFEVKEASLFITADVWEGVSFFIELQTNRLGKDDQLFSRTGEVYVHITDLIPSLKNTIGFKAGRIDLPFGEEYLWQDAIDNPLITNSVVYPYGWDEGLLLYGAISSVNWVVAITDGTDERSEEDESDKAINLKIYGNPFKNIYLSASWMKNGDAAKSAVEFGGSHFQPVGASHDSAVGDSPSTVVDGMLYELYGKYSFNLLDRKAYIALSAGGASQEDEASAYDRSWRWFSIEPLYNVTNTLYTVLRYSQIGTYDDQEGYHFDGKIFAGGNSAFGYDTEKFSRLGLGIGYLPNPRTRIKLEYAKDHFELIDASLIQTNNDDRDFLGVEIAVRF